MFSIHNFEESISATILKRGRDYYENGYVQKVKESGKGNWEAKVTGSEKYEVLLSLKNNDITRYDCDCPYDGEICKHVVAMLYYLSDKLSIDVIPKKAEQKKKPLSRKLSFENLLDLISLEEYKNFIGYYSTSDKNFKTNFELYFSHKDPKYDIEKNYTAIIKKLVKKYTDYGFMDYRSTKAFANEIHLIIKTAYDYFAKDNFRDALALTKVLIRELTKPIEWCDDSSGSLGDAISNSIDLLDEMATHTAVPFPVKEQINDFLNDELKNSLYFDYGNFGYEMTDVFFKAAKLTANHDGFIAFTDKKTQDYRFADYNREFFITQKVAFLHATGKTEDAKKLMAANIDIEEIRAFEIEQLKTKADYSAAKNLLYEGIALAEAEKHGGTVCKWQKELYTIAVLEKDLMAMRNYAKILAFDGTFDPEYYNRWKSTYTEQEWTEIIENYIEAKTHAITEAHNKETHRYYKLPLHIKLLENLSEIYIQEKYTDRILNFIKTGYNLDLLVEYHTVLLPDYATELLEFYPTALENECDRANNRSDYRGLANVMKKIIKTIPESKGQITQVVEKLIKKYPRRPAMIDEFNKI